jgi:hypothetical protein
MIEIKGSKSKLGILKRKFNILYILGVKDIKIKFLNIINSDLLSICINYSSDGLTTKFFVHICDFGARTEFYHRLPVVKS